MTPTELKALCDEADALQQIWQYPREPHTSADVSALTRSGLYLSFKLTAALREAAGEIEHLRQWKELAGRVGVEGEPQ